MLCPLPFKSLLLLTTLNPVGVNDILSLRLFPAADELAQSLASLPVLLLDAPLLVTIPLIQSIICQLSLAPVFFIIIHCGSNPTSTTGPSSLALPLYLPHLIIFWSSSLPNLKPAGSSNGVSVIDCVVLWDVIVPGVTVEPVGVFLLQHKSLVFVISVNPVVGGLNYVV